MAKRGRWHKEQWLKLFEDLMDQFGPHEEWETPKSPGHGRDADYEKFCVEFASYVGAQDADAIKFKVYTLSRSCAGPNGSLGVKSELTKCWGAALLTGFMKTKAMKDKTL